MPQTIGDRRQWGGLEGELGADWENLQRKWLHSIGNLTLTGYNTPMSNNPFGAKRAVFIDSNLRLNRWFVKHEHWTATEIEERGTEARRRDRKSLADGCGVRAKRCVGQAGPRRRAVETEPVHGACPARVLDVRRLLSEGHRLLRLAATR